MTFPNYSERWAVFYFLRSDNDFGYRFAMITVGLLLKVSQISLIFTVGAVTTIIFASNPVELLLPLAFIWTNFKLVRRMLTKIWCEEIDVFSTDFTSCFSSHDKVMMNRWWTFWWIPRSFLWRGCFVTFYIVIDKNQDDHWIISIFEFSQGLIIILSMKS